MQCAIFSSFGPLSVRKPAVSLADSSELRVILSILYTIVETVRVPAEDGDTEEFEELRKNFQAETGIIKQIDIHFSYLFFSDLSISKV